jgi:Conserved hypothetical protein 2217 (DUF2460)
MTTFPLLKTDAVAQYPARRTLRFQNQSLWFVDGTEQRYRDSGRPLHQWDILLDELDEGEMTALEAFFLTNQGAFATFPFTDPWDGTTYPNCSLASDEMDLVHGGEMLGGTRLTVVEHR